MQSGNTRAIGIYTAMIIDAINEAASKLAKD